MGAAVELIDWDCLGPEDEDGLKGMSLGAVLGRRIRGPVGESKVPRMPAMKFGFWERVLVLGGLEFGNTDRRGLAAFGMGRAGLGRGAGLGVGGSILKGVKESAH